MSSPRYTCAESTLTISRGNSRASASAMSVLPVPVGPVSTASGFFPDTLATAQEHAVQFLERHLGPGRPPVIALVGARRHFHLPQQRIHFGQRESTMRMDGGAA